MVVLVVDNCLPSFSSIIISFVVGGGCCAFVIIASSFVGALLDVIGAFFDGDGD